MVWKCDLSKYAYTCILNVPYYNGYFYAETQDGRHAATSKLFRINAADGQLQEVLDYGRKISSCAPCIIARGRVLSGDLHEDRTVATKIATAVVPSVAPDPRKPASIAAEFRRTLEHERRQRLFWNFDIGIGGTKDD